MADVKNHGTEQTPGAGHHILPLGVYYKVWAALIAFTLITVTSSYIDFGGSMNVIIAMVIATTKALLVTNFFMGLKYDSTENNITFYLAILFLGIFITLTGSDIFTRENLTAAHVDQSEMPQSTEPVDMKALLKPSPDALAKGKALFAQQCSTCHGPEGYGDGPAAAALNPKPRNFHGEEGWKNGKKISDLFKTLANGIPDTPMPSFSTLPISDRMALIHHVRMFMANPGKDSDSDLASLQSQGGGGGKPRLPVEFILKRMSEPEPLQ